MIRNCLKCGHSNQQATGDELEACPSCGAIYSRVEAAWGTRPAAPRAPQVAEAPRPVPVTREEAEVSIDTFAVRLRQTSLYPTFRNLVQVFYWALVLLAALFFLGAVIGVWKAEGTAAVGTFFFGITAGLFFLIVAKVSREMSLMLADLSDAAVRIASKTRP